jgi:anti-anti-sigma factor
MKYTADKTEKYCLITLDEDNINSLVAPHLKSEFVIIKNEGAKNLILNLEKVKFIDSSGLSAILTANRLWAEAGMFIVTGIENESVKKLISISRLDTVLTIIPTVSESIDYITIEDIEEKLKAESDSKE